MQIELDKREISDILNMINMSSFRGDSAEKVVILKNKLKTALEEDGKRNSG